MEVVRVFGEILEESDSDGIGTTMIYNHYILISTL